MAVTTNQDDRLLQALARRNLIIWCALTVISLFWQSQAVTLGVFCGGLVAVGGYYWLQRSIMALLAFPDPTAPRRYQFGYIIRLATLAAVLLVLIAVFKLHPVALAVGLSVVVINLLWTTLLRLTAPRRPDIS